ncbi:hypothetical protein GCM10008986_06330 [Salinibacillus aidingensis]|uniref:Uncharacterized protein n=1 Tax=Salinibacillus aidingensis TaxID=237684 RepID=A0ABP3KNP7_9BACI
MDGGRIVTVLSTKIWLIGLLILLPVIFISPDPILFLIVIFGALNWWERFKERDQVSLLLSELSILNELEHDRNQAYVQTDERSNQIKVLRIQLLTKQEEVQSYFTKQPENEEK